MSTAATNGGKLNNVLHQTPGNANKAAGSFGKLNSELTRLGGRFSLTYQAGTLFTAMFASFTVGQFVKGIYDTGTAMNKLNTAMFFATGTTEGAKTGTREYISMTQRLGLSLKDTADAYARFTISATTSGVKLADSNKVFESVAGTLAVVGASTQQIELAFYGLTQMIMKGKVSSEEFNRQIGEQIPGNAEIGAQAMSKLEGRFVSVAEFFDKMRKGEILSKDFLVAYAQALKEEFGPLLESAMKRPDKALARLRNSFTLFQAEIGKNGFMVAVGEQFNRFADKIVDAEGNLTPTAKKLAETFGRNLASMVRKAGDALVWLAENIDKVTLVAKALAGVLVVHAVTQWGSSIAGSAKILLDMASSAKAATGAILGLNAAQAASTATNAQAGVASAASTAGAVVGAPGGKNKGPIPGSTGGIIAARTAATIPTTTKMKGVAGIAQTGLNAIGLGNLIGRGTASAAAGAGKMAKIMGVARFAALGWVGAIMAVVSALALLSDKETLVGGESVQFGDIMGGMFDDLGKKFGSWWKDATAGFKGWGAGLKDLQLSSGEVFASIVAGLQWVIEGVADLTMAFVRSFDAYQKMKRGDFEGAQAAMGKIKESFADNDYGTMRDNIVKNAQERSARRGDQNGADDKAEAESKAAEEALARKRAEQEAMKLQSEKEGLARRIALGNQAELTWNDVIKRAQDAQQKSAEAQQSLATGAKDAGASMIAAAQNVAQIAAGIQPGTMLAGNIGAPVAGAFAASSGAKPYEAQMTRIAKQHGVDPEHMKRLIQVESGWRPGVAGTGGDAVGLGQFTTGTWNGVMPGHKASRDMGAADPRRDPALAMTATAKLMVQNNAAMKEVLGRDASAGEQYLAHFLGSGGARNLLAGMAANPNARVDQVRGITSSRGIANNPVFRGGQATLGEIYTWALDKFGETPAGVKAADGGVTARGAPGTGAMTAEEQEEAIKKGGDAQQRWLRMARRGDPALEARANRDLQRSEINELLGSQDKIMEMGLPSFIDPKDLVAVRDFIEKQAERGMNPFIEQREDSASRFEVTSMRSKGLEDEAAFRETVNGLLKQGYNFTQQQLEAERSLYVMDQQRLRVLSAKSAAQDSLNKAALDQIRDGADPVFANVMDRIDAIYEGGTLAEKKARALADGVFDIYSNIARAEIEAQASMEARDITRGLTNQRAEMSGTMAARSGESTRSLLGALIPDGANKTLAELTAAASTLNVEVNGAKQNMLAFAEASVKAQEALERQAGTLKVSRGLLDQARAAGMSNYDANRDASMRGTLEDLTGLSGLSMGELVAEASKLQVEIGGSSQSMLDFAKSVEKAKEELENRPGFERWAAGLDPLNKRLQDIKGDFMDGLGSGITDALMGEDVDWGQMAKELQKKVLRAHVDNMLAGIVNFATGKKPGEVTLTPEAQAALDAAKAVTESARKTDTSATNLNGSADKLVMAASALTNAASALANSGARGAAGFGSDVSAVTSTVLSAPSGAASGAQGAAWEGGLTGGVDGADYIARPSIAAPLQLEAAPSLAAAFDPLTTLQQGVDLNVPDLRQMPNPTLDNAAGGAAGGLSGMFQSLGPSIAAMITASVSKLPKNFESSSSFGNSLTLTPGETTASKFAGVTSMLQAVMGSGAPAQGAQGAAQGGGLFGSIGGFVKNLFGGGSGAMSGGSGTDVLSGGIGNDTLGAASGGIRGLMSSIGGFMGGGSANAGGFGGMLSGMMGKMGGAEGMLGLGLPLVMNLFKKKKKTEDILKPINGVIGEHRGVNVTGTAIAAHSNPIGDLMNMALSQFTGGFGAGGGMSLGKTLGNMGSSMASWFKEGGYSDTPVSRAAVPAINWSNVPHYSEGTPNTSGGMPAMLHPNEAVIPLSRGRSIPVELAGGGGSTGPSNPVMNTNITVVAPNPDGFRKAAGSIQRQTNRDMKRAAVRNLT